MQNAAFVPGSRAPKDRLGSLVQGQPTLSQSSHQQNGSNEPQLAHLAVMSKVPVRPHRGKYSRNSEVLSKDNIFVAFWRNLSKIQLGERENGDDLVIKVFLLLGIYIALYIFKEHNNLFS